MAYKTLLAFHAVEEVPSALDPVISLAKASNAHLDVIVLGTLISPSYMTHEMGPAAEWVQHNREIMDSATACVGEIEQYLAKQGITARVAAECDYPGQLDDIAARYSLCADIHVATRKSLTTHNCIKKAFNGTLFEAGCPFLQVPDEATDFDGMSRVAIAWNGRPEASRAIRDALPLLKNADRVNIISVDPNQRDLGDDPGSDLANYLSRYGIKVSVDVLASGGMSVSQKLLQRTKDIDADILVMGGYGHTKFREWLLGGATRETLEAAHLPVFMAH